MPFDTLSRSAASALAAARCLLATRVGTCTAPARCTNTERPSRLTAFQPLARRSRGLGAAINTGAVTRGKSVAVIGCGGVGCAAIAGSALAGASPVIAVDIDARKLEWARRFGATHTIDGSKDDVVDAILALTGGFGANVVVEAVGLPETYRQ